MPRINQYTDNTTIENDDKMLTYDTQGTATKLTAFSTIWNWIVRKLHALSSSSAALTPSTDRVLMDKNGTMTRVEPAAVAKYGIETYNGSTIAGSAQTVKSALDSLNSNISWKTLSDLGITTTPTTIRSIVNALPYGCNCVVSIANGEVTDCPVTGEIYIRKASRSGVIHKTDLVLRLNTASTSTLLGNYMIGMLPASGDALWYEPTLTQHTWS